MRDLKGYYGIVKHDAPTTMVFNNCKIRSLQDHPRARSAASEDYTIILSPREPTREIFINQSLKGGRNDGTSWDNAYTLKPRRLLIPVVSRQRPLLAETIRRMGNDLR